MIRLQEFSKLTTLMFAASLDQRKWLHFLEYLANLTGVRTHMFGHDVEHNRGLDLFSKSYDPEFLRTYNEYYAPLNSWAPGFFDHPVGNPIPIEAMCSRDVLEKTEFYNDWVSPQDDLVAGGGAILFKDQSRMFVIGGNIRRKDEHVEKGWLELVGLMTPHLQSALEINRLLAEQKVNKIAGDQNLNTNNAAILIVNNFGKVVFANQVAEDKFDNGEIIKSDHRRHLEFTDFYPDTVFRKSIHALNQMNADVSSQFECAGQHKNSRYSCRTLRFDPRNHDISPFGILISVFEPCVLLVINEIKFHKTTATELVERFRISASEAEIVLKIFQGLSTRDISNQREVSIHTVRNQLKSAMSKMNVRKQVDLVNLVRNSI